jgi:diguanylate cyclase (GGDEF)-like protein
VKVEAARFRTALVEAYSKAHKAGAPLTVWWLDVDDCSKLNDNFGEGAVDLALAEFERELRVLSDAQEGAVFARMDGAAWAVAFPGLDQTAAAVSAETMRQAQARKEGIALSFSVGIACRKLGEPALNLLEEAELACTRAKQAGRGQVILR